MPVDNAQPPIDYANAAIRRGRGTERAFDVAFACGIIPAVLGTLIIGLWLSTRWMGLVAFGIANFFLGLLCTLIGGIALVVYLWRAIASGRRPVRRWLVRGIVAGALLLGNFPLSGLCITLASLNRLDVVNATGANVSSFVVADPNGDKWEVGPIPAGGRRRRWIRAQGEGAVTFTANINGTSTPGVVQAYYTNGMGGRDWTVTLNPDGSHSVQ
jgi:hypothetical protein